MKPSVFFSDMTVAYVRVDLRCGNAGVPQQFLDHAKVGAAFKHVSSEAVSQPMRRQIGNSPGTRALFDAEP